MSTLNPYEKYLDERPAEEILAATPAVLQKLIDTMGADRALIAPAPGRWNAAQIAAHLADCEIVFSFRLRQTVAEDGPVIQPFDQDRWAAAYSGFSAAEALAAFSAIRSWNLRFLGAVLPAASGRIMTHPERGAMTFQTVVETMAGHDLNHLGQLERIAAN